MLHILDTGMSYAEDNMNLDFHFLNDLDPSSKPVLHLYHWSRPSATFGYFIKPEKHINLEKAALHGLDLARRPTGGGDCVSYLGFGLFLFNAGKSPRIFYKYAKKLSICQPSGFGDGQRIFSFIS